MTGVSFFAELRKRKVLQAAAIYGAVSWGVTEVVVTVTDQLFLPQWISTLADPGSALAHSRLADALLYLRDLEAVP